MQYAGDKPQRKIFISTEASQFLTAEEQAPREKNDMVVIPNMTEADGEENE
jgi:hypothetical protein